MSVKLTGLGAGIAFGFILSWSRLTDPAVIREMLLLQEAHVFLIMGSAIAVAAVGCQLLRAAGAQSILTAEPIQWPVAQPERRHLVGSLLFGTGWSVAGTCPGPVAAMIGQGRLGGVAVGIGILAGVVLQPVLVRPRTATQRRSDCADAVGL